MASGGVRRDPRRSAERSGAEVKAGRGEAAGARRAETDESLRARLGARSRPGRESRERMTSSVDPGTDREPPPR